MKKLQLLMVLLALSGCVGKYHPELVTPAEDADKYEADRRQCVYAAQKLTHEADTKYRARNMLGVGFGAIGILAGRSIQPTEEKYAKSSRQMVDECMTERGYDLVKVDHFLLPHN